MTSTITRILGMPLVASEHGSGIDNLIWYVHILMGLLFVGWSAYFVFVLFRFNHKRNPKANYHGVRGHTSNYLEGAVALVEVILLVGLAIPLWARNVERPPVDEDTLEIHVAGRQFSWMARYPGPDGVLGALDKRYVTPENPWGVLPSDPHAPDDIEVVNEFIAPVNRNVIAHVTSLDVVHSFTIKPMRITQDAIPGMSVPVWFKPIREGEYMIQCAQLCGTGHYAMRGTFKVVSPEEYDEWIHNQSPSTSSENVLPEEDSLSPFE